MNLNDCCIIKDFFNLKANEDEKIYAQGTVPKITDDFTDKEKLIDSVVKNVLWQMDSDRKTQALKQLQGHIWKIAYENGFVTGQLVFLRYI